MKPFYYLLVFLNFSILTDTCLAQSPNTWVQKANFGGAARLWAVGFSI